MKKSENNTKEFTGIRSFIWPIHSYELKKFLPLTLIFFCISFNYSALRNLKDILVLDSGGAEAIPFIKTYGVMPMVILYTMIYNSLSNRYGRDRLFYMTISYFVAFFFVFTFFLYPNREALVLNSFYTKANEILPSLNGMWSAIKFWFISLFYINAELWGTFGISIALWTFINEITSVKQSKRFYSFLAIGANIALIFSGTFLSVIKNTPSGKPFLFYTVLSLGVFTLILYRWFTAKIALDPKGYDIEEKVKKKKAKLSMLESLKFLFKSRYLRLIATLVFCYGMVINLIEIVWKSQIKELQVVGGGNEGILLSIYSYETILIGVTAIISIFFSSKVISRGWIVGALVTPISASVLGAIFFSFMVFGKGLSFFQTYLGISSLMLAVIVGMLQVVLIKSFKYTLFDPTKESSYIPLDPESKIRGKAAVDGIGGRLGKAGGSALMTVLIPLIGGGRIDGVVPYLFFIIAAILAVWINAAISLDVEFKKAISAKNKEENN